MAVPLTNVTLRDIANEVEFTSGTTFSNPLSFETIRNAADFAGFNPTYLDGAASLSDVKSFGQFRDYPGGGDFLTVRLRIQATSSNTPPGTRFDTRIAIYDVQTGVDVLLDTIQWKLTTPPATATVSAYPSGYNGSTGSVIFGGYGASGTSPYPTDGEVFISRVRTFTLAGTKKLKLVLSDATGLNPVFTLIQYWGYDTKQTINSWPAAELDYSTGTPTGYAKAISKTTIYLNL